MMAKPRWNAARPKDQALVLTYHDGSRAILPFGNASVLQILHESQTGAYAGDQTVALQGVTDATIENAALAKLEEDVRAPLDLGTPVSEWDDA